MAQTLLPAETPRSESAGATKRGSQGGLEETQEPEGVLRTAWLILLFPGGSLRSESQGSKLLLFSISLPRAQAARHGQHASRFPSAVSFGKAEGTGLRKLHYTNAGTYTATLRCNLLLDRHRDMSVGKPMSMLKRTMRPSAQSPKCRLARLVLPIVFCKPRSGVSGAWPMESDPMDLQPRPSSAQHSFAHRTPRSTGKLRTRTLRRSTPEIVWRRNCSGGPLQPPHMGPTKADRTCQHYYGFHVGPATVGLSPGRQETRKSNLVTAGGSVVSVRNQASQRSTKMSSGGELKIGRTG